LCGDLRLVASVQVAPEARLKEAKCLMEVGSEIIGFQFQKSACSGDTPPIRPSQGFPANSADIGGEVIQLLIQPAIDALA